MYRHYAVSALGKIGINIGKVLRHRRSCGRKNWAALHPAVHLIFLKIHPVTIAIVADEDINRHDGNAQIAGNLPWHICRAIGNNPDCHRADHLWRIYEYRLSYKRQGLL